MGNIQNIEKKKEIFYKLISEYEILKQRGDSQIFEKMIKKYDNLTTVPLKTLDLFDLDISMADGVIKTDTFTLIGWNDDNEDIDLNELEKTIKYNEKKEKENDEK